MYPLRVLMLLLYYLLVGPSITLDAGRLNKASAISQRCSTLDEFKRVNQFCKPVLGAHKRRRGYLEEPSGMTTCFQAENYVQACWVTILSLISAS